MKLVELLIVGDGNLAAGVEGVLQFIDPLKSPKHKSR